MIDFLMLVLGLLMTVGSFALLAVGRPFAAQVAMFVGIVAVQQGWRGL